MQCPKCNNTLPDGASFCGACGTSIPQQAPQMQPMYQGNPQQPIYHPQNMNDTPLSVGSFLIMFLVMSIPIVNFIMLFVWGFGNGNTNRKNFARAALIVMAIGIVLSILLGGIMGAFMMQMVESGEFY